MSAVRDIRSAFAREAAAGSFGTVQTLPVRSLIGRQVYETRLDVLDLALAAKDEAEFIAGVEGTEYFRIQASRLDGAAAIRKAIRYRTLLHSIRENGQLQDRKNLPIVVWQDGRLLKRLDGTHRLSAMQFLGHETATCIVVEPQEYLDYLIKHGMPRFAKWYQSIEIVPGVWTNPRREHKEGATLAMLPDVAGKTVLDLGCNSGLYSLVAARRGASAVFGIDKRAESIDQAEFVKHIWSITDPTPCEATFIAGNIADNMNLVVGADVLLACCVVYHLGEALHPFWRTVHGSSIQTVLLQGNENRVRKLDPAKVGQPVTEKTPAQYLYNLAGFRALMAMYGFRCVGEHGGPYPVGVFARATNATA